MTLLDAYRRYYQTPDRTAFRSLYEAICTFDFSEDVSAAAFELRGRASKTTDAARLPTGGSTTGFATSYRFGPHASSWFLHIEKWLRLDGSRLRCYDGALLL